MNSVITVAIRVIYKVQEDTKKERKKDTKKERKTFNICYAAGCISKECQEKKELNKEEGTLSVEERRNTGSKMAGLE